MKFGLWWPFFFSFSTECFFFGRLIVPEPTPRVLALTPS